MKTIKPRAPVLGPRAPVLQGGKKGHDQRRSATQPWRKWYHTARWRELRRRVLDRAAWTCQQTGVPLRGRGHAPDTAVVDHVRPHRGDPALFWDEANLQARKRGTTAKSNARSELPSRRRGAGADPYNRTAPETGANNHSEVFFRDAGI